MAAEDSSGTAAQTSVRTTNAGTHKAFIVALLLRAILAGLIHLESLQGTEPPRTTWTARPGYGSPVGGGVSHILYHRQKSSGLLFLEVGAVLFVFVAEGLQ